MSDFAIGLFSTYLLVYPVTALAVLRDLFTLSTRLRECRRVCVVVPDHSCVGTYQTI